jgi:hypothetical protein
MYERKRIHLVQVAVGSLFLPLIPGCGDGGGRNTNQSPPETSQKSEPRVVIEAAIDIAGIFYSHPVIKLLRFLKIVITTAEAIATAIHDKENNEIVYKTTNEKVRGVINIAEPYTDVAQFRTPTGTLLFQPGEFLKINNVAEGDDDALQQVDAQINADYTRCTDEALNTGEGNHVRLFELRIACYEKMGVNQHNLNYTKVKHEKYQRI